MGSIVNDFGRFIGDFIHPIGDIRSFNGDSIHSIGDTSHFIQLHVKCFFVDFPDDCFW